MENKKCPHVVFQYNKEKDLENIEIGLETIHKGRRPDNELGMIINQYGETPSKEDLEKYISSRWEGKENLQTLILSQLQEYWDSIEEKFFFYIAEKMQLSNFYGIESLNGYLSLRHGNGYNTEENWFAVSAHQGTLQNTLTAMHEIMHIFFHKAWWSFCKEQGVSEKNIWDIKEAITVLLNLWFKNQLIDIDWGYKEHTELRKNIKKWFLESRDFKITLQKACDYTKTNKEKSPPWV